MKTHEIDLSSFLCKGYVTSELKNSELMMTNSFNARFKRIGEDGGKAIGYKLCGNEMHVPSYIYLPDKYKIPLRIDMTFKIDSPSLHFMLGSGHITFGRDNASSIDFTDISGESHMSNRQRQNHIRYNDYNKISIFFDFKFMQIIINDEIRYHSNKEKYMVSKLFPQKNREGLEIKITCDKNSELWIKDIIVTEYDNDVPEYKAPTEGINVFSEEKVEKHDFEFYISKLSKELRDEVRLTNEFIMSLKPLKLKRKIQSKGAYGEITYISDYGFSYRIQTQRDMLVHDMGWIIYNTKREQEKYGGVRKRELTGKTLEKLAKESPVFADRMFENLNECFGCGCRGEQKTCKLDGCILCGETYGLCPTLINYNGKKKAACHGRMAFKMIPSDFADVRKVIGAINDIICIG